MNLIEAMEAPDTFAPWFAGPSWATWKAILRAAFALPMTDEEIATFGELAGGRSPPQQRVKELWVVAGRRSGKDSVASGVAAWISGIEQSHVGRLRPGELASVICLACDRDQAKIVKNYSQSYFTAIDDLRAKVTRETRVGLELDNGAEIVIATNSFRQARGRAILLALLDECAFFRDETSVNPDVEVYRAILPGLATLPDSMLIAFSSPYRKGGLLYDKWKAHFGKDDDRVLVIQAESTQLNPTLDPAIIAEALEADPAAARAEWLGQFRDDIAGYIDIEMIEAAVDRGVVVRAPVPGVQYAAFADPSGGVSDAFTLGVAHAEGESVILDCLVEIKAPFNPTSATEAMAKTLKTYGLASVVGDRYAASWTVDAFAKCGIRYQHSERDRSAIYSDALPLFTAGRARLLDNKRLVNQLASLERRTSSTGRDRIDHPAGAGSHDDCANAVAGALSLAAVAKKPMTFTMPWGATRSDGARDFAREATRPNYDEWSNRNPFSGAR